MKQKTIQVTKPFLPDFDEYCREIKDLWESAWLTNGGEKHIAFEQALSEYLEVPFLSLFSNGHMALELAIAAFNLKGECITTPFTHCSTTNSIVRCGLKPVFCDVSEETGTIDPHRIVERITPKTSAIVATHVYGIPCDVEAIEQIAVQYGLKVIYDGAHAFGVRYKGKSIASYGDAVMFSCHATKVFHTIEGGITVFREEQYRKKANELLNFGYVDKEVITSVGVNARMNEFEAAMGLCNLRHFAEELEARRKVADCYREAFSGMPYVHMLKKPEETIGNYAYYPVFFRHPSKSRNEILAALREQGINGREYFHPLVNEMPCYLPEYGSETGHTPVAKKLAESVIALPMYGSLSVSEVERICNAVQKAMNL